MFILIWQLFVNASEPTEEWIVYYEDENTVHKCKREDYLEIMDFMESNSKERQFLEYLEWEYKNKFKKRKR